jgi:5-methylcytosine-specific restriction endonuclease McrA
MAACSIAGCEGPTSVPGAARGWCRAHYKRWYRYGDPTAPIRRVYRYDTPCTVDGCDDAVYGLGLCETHYARQRRTGSVDLVERIDPGCDVEGCAEGHYATGVCRYHYDQRRGARPGEPNPEAAAFRARRRCDRLRGATGSHTLEEWLAKLAEYGGRCAYCPSPADTRDHVIPLAEGGTDEIDNIVPACRPCNSRKGSLTVDAWTARRIRHGEAVG